MARIYNVETYSNRRLQPENLAIWGKTSVVEGSKSIPFGIKRIFYIYGTDPGVTRGGHRLKTAKQGLICLHGEYDVYVNNGRDQQHILLDSPDRCLILENEDWHIMTPLIKDSILLVISSEFYDVNDYIDEPYPDTPLEIIKATKNLELPFTKSKPHNGEIKSL